MKIRLLFTEPYHTCNFLKFCHNIVNVPHLRNVTGMYNYREPTKMQKQFMYIHKINMYKVIHTILYNDKSLK